MARNVLGWRLVSDIDAARTAVEINEVEAYAGETDPASHAYRGETARNRSMFGPPGTLYVYRSYGIHWCMNLVCGPPGTARAVLLRGGIVVSGEQAIMARRGREDHLTDGPGKLTQALGVTGEHDGHDLAVAPLRLLAPQRQVVTVDTGPRVGITKAVARPWRFQVTEWSAAGSLRG